MSSRAVVALVLALGGGLPACAAGDALGTSQGAGGAGGPGGAAGSGGRAGGTGSAPSSTGSAMSGTGASGPDAGSPSASDGIPAGAVSYFDSVGCPTGWTAYAAAKGRFLLPTVGSAPGGLPYGTPLASGEDPRHTHVVNATFMLPSVSYAGIAGCCNGGVSASGDATLTTTSEAASTGLPYVQLLTCKKIAAAKPATGLPRGMQMFFDAPACPAGWGQTAATQGRLIVGLPDGAAADLSFGGSALQGGSPRTHAHATPAALTAPSHGIALLGGGAANGYAASGTFMSMQETDTAESGLPTLSLLSCEKQ